MFFENQAVILKFLLFTAEQAAQKNLNLNGTCHELFTAEQAAQKKAASLPFKVVRFTAEQAAQKFICTTVRREI